MGELLKKACELFCRTVRIKAIKRKFNKCHRVYNKYMKQYWHAMRMYKRYEKLYGKIQPPKGE